MTTKLCPTCSTPIPAAAPGGFCPGCLLRDAAEPASTGQPAPSLEEVAEAFPTLEIISLIGQGGMGSVYKVRQPSLDRIVALKLLAPQLSRDPAFAERFTREARVLGKLNHPNIVTVYEHGESGGFYYLIMEYVDGVNLRQAMRAGRFTPEQALSIVPGICDALQAAHAQGIWHRDIKPENILLDQRGGVKIADFGIAKLVEDQTKNFTLTGTGNALGSIAYMAPEQHESPHTVDHRADIYSLGVVIYEMLTGELPLGRFPAPSQRAAVSTRIDEIVFQTLEKERELRQQSATEVKTDVQSVREINRDPLPLPSAKNGWTPRSTAKAAMLGGLVLFISATIFTRGSTQSLLLALSAVPIAMGFLGWIFLPKPALTVEEVLREMNRLANEHLSEKFGELLATGSSLAAPDSFQFGRQLLEGTLIHFHRGQARPLDFMNRPQVSLVAELLRSNGDQESVECLFREEAEGWRLVDCQVGALKVDDGRNHLPSDGESKKSQKATAGKQLPSLAPTLILHTTLFALLTAIFLVVLPRFGEILSDMGVPRSYIPRLPVFVETLLLFPVLLGIDIGLCFLVRKMRGRRGLRQWSIAVIFVMVSVVVISSGALYLPLKSVIANIGGPTSAEKSERAAEEARIAAEKNWDALNEKKQLEANEQRDALKKKFPNRSTPQGAVIAYHDGLDQHDIETVLASIANQRLALAASPNAYARELIETEDGDGGVKGDLRTIIVVGEPSFDTASGLARLEYQKRILGKNPSVLSATEKCVKQGNQWRVLPDAEPTLKRTQSATPAVPGAEGSESWTYTPRHMTSSEIENFIKSPVGKYSSIDKKRNFGWTEGMTTQFSNGKFTLAGPTEQVRPLMSWIRMLDITKIPPAGTRRGEIPPNFMAILAVAAMMVHDEFDEKMLGTGFYKTLQAEKISAVQLARSLRNHVWEFEKITIAGAPKENVGKSDALGATITYEITIPCSDRMNDPLKLSFIEINLGFRKEEKFISLSPWLLEEAKMQSAEPFVKKTENREATMAPKLTAPAINKWPTMPGYDAAASSIASSNIRDNSTALESFKVLQFSEEGIGLLIRQHETGTPLFWGSVIQAMSNQLLACLVGTALEQRAERQRNRYIFLYQAMAAKDWTKAEMLFKERPDKDFEPDLRQLVDADTKRRHPILNEGNQSLVNSEKSNSPKVSATPTLFLEWAQGEWVLDREETLRAIGALIPDEEKRKIVLEKVRTGFAPYIDSDRLKFLPDTVTSWQVGKPGVPVPSDIPSFGKLTISSIPKPSPESSAESMEVILQLRMQGMPEVEAESRPSTFSKTKEGLLHWKFEYNGEKRLAVYRRSDETKPTDAASTDVESWNYNLRHLDAGKLEAKMKANPVANVTTKVEAGVVTLTGPRDPVRQLATMLRVIDQAEVKNPLELPLLNMPPDFFTRMAIPALMSGKEFSDTQFEPAFFETLKRENITASQLARALRAHVLELEKATFVNTGTPFESIMKTPGASTYYDATIPCADQPDKPLTFRIRRTTQTMGTKPDIAGLAPWLLEEAKLQSKEPIVSPTKIMNKSEPAKESAIPQPEAKPAAEAPAQPASDVRLNVEIKSSSTQGTQRSENRTISIQAEKPGYVHLWMPGGKRFTEKLNDNSKVAHIGFHNTKGFSSRVSYSLYQKDGPVLEYGIAQPAQLVELAKQSISYDDAAKGLREVRDPTGICLRNAIYDLAPIGDSALLLAVTDIAEPPPDTQYFLHIWQPPLQHAVPPQSGTPFESIPVRIGEMLVTPGEPGKNVGNKLTGQRVGRISQRDGKYHADLHYSAGSTAMLNQPMTPEVPIAVSMHMISAGGMWPQFMLLSTKPDVTPFLKEEFFKPATAEEIQRGTSLAQQAQQLAATKGKVWKSGVLDMRRANGVEFQQILMLEFAPFAGQRENPPQVSVKVSSTSPTVKEGPITLSVGIGNSDFSDVRLEEKDGTRTMRITRAIETVDQPREKTARILNQLSFSFAYLLTTDTLTLKAGTLKVEGIPSGEINWGSIGFVTPTRDIVFKLTP